MFAERSAQIAPKGQTLLFVASVLFFYVITRQTREKQPLQKHREVENDWLKEKEKLENQTGSNGVHFFHYVMG